MRGNIIRQDKDAHDKTVTGAIVEFTYDALNRKLTETYTNRNLVDRQAWSYQNGQLRSYQDMAGSITAYRYDSAGRLANEYRADAALNQIAGQKNISYAYDIYGNVTEINDAGTSTMTRYAYDAAGHRTWEQIAQDANVILQNNYLSYDELGRLRKVEDGRFSLTYDYDANGNRERVIVNNYRDGSPGKTELWNRYDSMNRLIVADGVKDGSGNVTISQTQGHSMQYDKAGRVLEDKSYGKVAWWDGSKWGTRDNVLKTVSYAYDKMGRLITTTQRNEGDTYDYVTDVRTYDAYGRVVRSGTSTSLLSDDGKGANAGFRQAMSDAGTSIGAQLNTYRTEWVTSHVKLGVPTNGLSNFSQTDHVNIVSDFGKGYTSTFNRYDDAGNISAVVFGGDRKSAIQSVYSYRKADSYQISNIVTNSQWTGSMLGTSDWNFDVNGHATKIVDRNGKDRIMQVDTAGHILRSTQAGQTSYALLINDEIVGNTSKEAKDDTIGRAWQSAMSLGAGQSSNSYVVQSGDSFAAIAKKVWGDSSLWFLIADANGLSGDDSLAAGQILIIPARTAGLHNNTGTSKTYNPADILGDTSPTLVRPQDEQGCGPVGIIVTLAVRIALNYLIPGAGEAAHPFINAAISFASSTAGQAAAVSAGEQKEINWRGNALSAIYSSPSYGLESVVGQAVISNTLTQATSVAFGWQESFSWRSVAASAVGAGVGYGVGNLLEQSGAFKFLGNDYATKIAQATVRGFAAGAASQLVGGGKVNFGQVALDAFGNGIESGIKESLEKSAAIDTAKAAISAGEKVFSQVGKDAFGNALGAVQPTPLNIDVQSEVGGYDPEVLAAAGYPRDAQFFMEPDGIDRLTVSSGSPNGRDDKLNPNYFADREDRANLKKLEANVAKLKELIRQQNVEEARRFAAAYSETENTRLLSRYPLLDSEATTGESILTNFVQGAENVVHGLAQRGLPVDFVAEQAVTTPNVTATGDAKAETSKSDSIPWYIPQNMLSGAMQSWDSFQRARYTSVIKQASQQAIQVIDNAWIFNDVRHATDAAWQASETRNSVRLSTQQRLSWSGYQISKALDKSKDVAAYFSAYRPENPDPIALAKKVAVKAGSSNPYATGFAWAGRIIGPAGVLIGAVKGYNAVQNAPEGQKGYIAAQEVSGQVLGAALGMASAGLAVMALGSNPFGWLVIGASIAGGMAGGLAGDYAGRWGAQQIYNLPWRK